jgi:hypothetical protein
MNLAILGSEWPITTEFESLCRFPRSIIAVFGLQAQPEANEITKASSPASSMRSKGCSDCHLPRGSGLLLLGCYQNQHVLRFESANRMYSKSGDVCPFFFSL